ncbi:hypothetical protein WH47_02769 [Habropoda laboriosa]|uniref:Uncharacterized protein n=1 Tax=Habropoda laboriosa TaxID=597456 RepID=A0A0L7QXC5_9HYME|nr:hypothetical protein WH47_02769 [Habropoda laboriosa]
MEYAVKYGALRKMYEFLEKGNGGYVTILTSLSIANRDIVILIGTTLVTFHHVFFMTSGPLLTYESILSVYCSRIIFRSTAYVNDAVTPPIADWREI